MKDEDKRGIINNDSLDLGDLEPPAPSNGHVADAEDRPIRASGKLEADILDGQDAKYLKGLFGIGIAIAALSAIALGIGFAAGNKQVKETGIVTSDCAICADMGLDILKNGGSAVDATVTTLLCNGVVNLHSSGIGGGGFMMIRDHKNNYSLALDFHMAAPLAATPELYVDVEQLQFGRLSVAVPGEIAGLAMAHKQFGKLPWKDLVTPVSKLARDGFEITKDVNFWANKRAGIRFHSNNTNTKLFDFLHDENGLPKKAGTMVKRPEYADALDIIADNPMKFYKSSISEDISNSLNGSITAEDLEAYQARAADIIKMKYLGFNLETVGSPAGGVILFHILKVLEGYKFTADGHDNVSSLMYHRVVEAIKFGFASFPDNADFSDNSESNFTESLLGEGHCDEIRKRITDNSTHDPSYYDPKYTTKPDQGTSAVAVIDDNELFVSSISSINNLFGAAIMTEKYGIVLNNGMDDFDFENFTQSLEGEKLRPNPANFVKGGRRPRSSMSPTVFYNSKSKCGIRGAVGGVGGLKIIPATLQYLLDVLSFGLDSEASIHRPRLQHSLLPNTLKIEENFDDKVQHDLKIKGHNIVQQQKDQYLAVISAAYKTAKSLDGSGDFRKQGKSVQYEQ